MHFSVTKEVGWEADDEREDPKLNLGLKKRYRFILDFSRRSSKTNKASTSSKGPPPESDDDDEEEEEEDENYPADGLHSNGSPRPRSKHYCYNCEAPRSSHYHKAYPLRRHGGRSPRPSLCTRCRSRRKARLADADADADDGSRDGGNHHHHHQGRHSHHHHARQRHVRHTTITTTANPDPDTDTDTDTEPRGDDREWCARCGTLRSNKFHDKVLLLGGSGGGGGGGGGMPPWKEVCGRCVEGVMRREGRGRVLLRRRGGEYEGGGYEEEEWGERRRDVVDWVGDRGDGRGEGGRHDPLRESLLHPRRSRPYVFAPSAFRQGGAGVAVGTSVAGRRGGSEHAQDAKHGGPPMAETGDREKVSGSSLGTSKGRERREANSRKVTVEDHASDDGCVPVRRDRQTRQEGRETQQHKSHERREQPKAKADSRQATSHYPTRGSTKRGEAHEQPRPRQPGQPTQENQRYTQPREEQPHLFKVSTTMGGVERHQEGRDLCGYFLPLRLEAHYQQQIRAKPRPHEPREKPMPPPAPSTVPSSQQYQKPHETRDYFRLPNPMKPLESGEKPTTAADSKQRRDSGEPRDRNPTRPSHRKRASVSSSKQSPVLAASEPVYFKYSLPAKYQAQQPKPKPRPKPQPQPQPKPTYPANPLPNRRKPKPKPGPEVSFEQQRRRQQEWEQQQQREKDHQEQASPPRRMGISDMYWRSADGQAEQTHAAAGFFFPGAAHGPGVTKNTADPPRSNTASSAACGRNGRHSNKDASGKDGSSSSNRNGNDCNSGNNGNNNNNTPHASASAEYECPPTTTMPDFGHVFRASMGEQMAAAEAVETVVFGGDGNDQVWEVDSDEAEEIEEGRVRLFC